MKSLRLALVSLALAPFAFAALEEHLPGATFGVIKIENVSRSAARLDAHPVAKSAGMEKLKAFFAPVLAKAKDDDAKSFAEFEKFRTALATHLKGEILVAGVRTPNPIADHAPYDFLLLADTDADDETLAAMLKEAKLFQPTPETVDVPTPAEAKGKAEPLADDDETPDRVAGKPKPKLEIPKFESVEEEFAGVKLHFLASKTSEKSVNLGGWALVNKTFVGATAPNVLKELVESVKSGRKDAFTDSAVYKANKDALSDRDLWMLLNPPVIAEAVRDHLVSAREAAKKAGRPAPGGGMFDPVRTFDAMAFGNITHLRICASLKADDTRVDSAIGWKEFKGFVTLFQYKADEKPETFLAPADAISADAGRMDLSAMLAALEGMIRDAFPFAAPMLDVQLDKLKNDEGLDIRSAILANFGDSVVTVTGEASEGASPLDAMPQVWVVSLKDETKLASFIETALGKVAASQTGDGKKSLFDEREILGVKVRDIKTGGAGPRIAYALHHNRLIVSKGDPVLLNKVLGQLVNPKAGIDTTPAHRAGLERLPAGGCAVSHADLGRLTTVICNLIVNAADKSPLGGGSKPVFDTTKIPSAGDFPFVVVGKSYATPGGIETKAVLVAKGGAEAR